MEIRLIEKEKKQTENMPDWLFHKENYIPQKERDTFVNKSILSVFRVISRMKIQDVKGEPKYQNNVALRVLGTLLLVVLVSLTRSFVFVAIAIVYLLLQLSALEGDRLVRILKISFGFTVFTAIIMLPAFISGNSYSTIMITAKVFYTITSMGVLSHTTKWNAITEALKLFHTPDIFILILDITIKYIYKLGELSLHLLYALKLRSVGKNHNKYSSLAGIAGNTFLKSKEMAEEMYHAMECRGFTGEYKVNSKSHFGWLDYMYIGIYLGFILLFIYFGRIVYD